MDVISQHGEEFQIKRQKSLILSCEISIIPFTDGGPQPPIICYVALLSLSFPLSGSSPMWTERGLSLFQSGHIATTFIAVSHAFIYFSKQWHFFL